MEVSAKFWDKLAVRYSKRPIANVPAYEHKLKVTQSYMSQDTEVLEVGCGTGSTALIHASKVKHIVATDISSGMLDIARLKALDKGVNNVDFVTSSVEDLRLENPVDMVLALSLLHLVEDKDFVLSKLYDQLKPGGLLVTSTVCMGESLKIFKYIGPIGKMLGLMPTLKVFTQQNLKQSILDAGFSIDYQWRPDSGHSLFVVAKKPEPC